MISNVLLLYLCHLKTEYRLKGRKFVFKKKNYSQSVKTFFCGFRGFIGGGGGWVITSENLKMPVSQLNSLRDLKVR